MIQQGPRKPHWLKQEDWSALLDRYDGIPRCAETGEIDDLTVDHIIPRHDGGSDDISNLQFLKSRANIRKGIKPDKYWNQPFFFDQIPNLIKCRSAQRGLYNTILSYANWFSQPTTQISRLLYTYAMVVGAGKTLSALAAACAYNAIMRAKWGAIRRADRILVLCKERAIRDQIVRDTRTDTVRFDIFSNTPRVGVIIHGGQLDDESWLSSNDVVVSCIQQLWDNGRNIARLLHRFPVIVIDEPHYAFDQVNSIVEAATTSVCFGGTGSPIDGLGNLLDRMIRLYVFGYQDADDNDRSMKYLTLNNWETQHLIVTKLDEAQLLDASGGITTTNNTNSPGYDKNFEPAKSVVWRTILHIESCDNIEPLFANKAPHRQEYDCEIDVFFPVHAMICCDSVPFANLLARNTNELLSKQRRRFPLDRGWQAEVVHCEGEEPDGRLRDDKPLLPGHPWLRASKQAGYQLDSKCARLLFVVGMGREGVNNPLCGVVGVTSNKASQIEGIQRIIGRQNRAIVLFKNGHWFVPPDKLDIVTIVTHEVFSDIRAVIKNCIDFILNMETKLQAMPTIDMLEDGDKLPEWQKSAADLLIPFKDKIGIIGLVGSNPEIEDDTIVTTVAPGNPGMERPIVDFIKKVRENPVKVGHDLKIGRNHQVRTYLTVLWEAIIRNPDDEQLRAFLRHKHPELAGIKIIDDTRLVMLKLYKVDAGEVAAATPPLFNPNGSIRHIDDIRKNIGGAIIKNLGSHFIKSRKGDNDLWSFTGRAIKTVLGVPDGGSASNGSSWDTPNCLIMLERPDIHREIQRYVIGRLIEAGHCPSLQILQS